MFVFTDQRRLPMETHLALQWSVFPLRLSVRLSMWLAEEQRLESLKSLEIVYKWMWLA